MKKTGDNMAGYEIRLLLLSSTQTWRTLNIPKDLSFKELHELIQKVFGFKNYHNFDFKVPYDCPDKDYVDLSRIIRTIDSEDCDKIPISEVFGEYQVVLYAYDFGDGWEIIIDKLDDIDYDENYALITDYAGKYNPLDDMGGVDVFDEIMDALGDEDLEYILDDYGLTMSDLEKMDFEKAFMACSSVTFK